MMMSASTTKRCGNARVTGYPEVTIESTQRRKAPVCAWPLWKQSWPWGLGQGMCSLRGELGGNRTHDPRLKRALLYQLSYELV